MLLCALWYRTFFLKPRLWGQMLHEITAEKEEKKDCNPLGYKQKVESMKGMQNKSSECQNDPP